MPSFSVRLRDIRGQNGLTVDEVAMRSGLSKALIFKLESGERGKTFEKLPRIAKALGCQIDDLFPEMDEERQEAPQAQPDGDQLPGKMDMDDIDTWGD